MMMCVLGQKVFCFFLRMAPKHRTREYIERLQSVGSTYTENKDHSSHHYTSSTGPRAKHSASTHPIDHNSVSLKNERKAEFCISNTAKIRDTILGKERKGGKERRKNAERHEKKKKDPPNRNEIGKKKRRRKWYVPLCRLVKARRRASTESERLFCVQQKGRRVDLRRYMS